MSIKDFIKYKCEECGKNFTHNIGLKGHITAVHERKDSIVINVFMKKTLNSIVVHEKDFELNCDHYGKNYI